MSGRTSFVPRSVSVLMPTYQAETYLDRVLAALAAQEVDFPWDFTAVDCGSTDATLSIFARWAERFPVPFAVRPLGRDAFDHGDTRNYLAALTHGDLLVYLTDDAIPARSDWLASLRANFHDPRVAAAYCRNVPRPDARAFARIATRDDPTYAAGPRLSKRPTRAEELELGPEELRLLYNFSDTASAVRRSAWELHPYPITQAGEDVLLARALVDSGHVVVYDTKAVVLHSHEWSGERVRKRAAVDGRFNAETFGREPIVDEADAERRVAQALVGDRTALERLGLAGDELEREMAHANLQRRAHFLGLLEGQRVRPRRLRSTLLDSPWLAIALVCPAERADPRIEARARALQRAFEAHGHSCEVLTRAPSDAAPNEGAPSEARPKAASSEVPVPREYDALHVLDSRDLEGWARSHPRLEHVPAAIPENGAWRLSMTGLAALATPNRTLITDARIEPREPTPAKFEEDGALPNELEIADEALRWESRYRALATCARSAVVVDRWARESDEREGDVRAQGGETLLCGPRPGAVTFDLGALPPDAWTIELHLEMLAVEREVVMHGRITLDGRAPQEFGPLGSKGVDHIEVVEVVLPAGSRPRRVRVENLTDHTFPRFVRLRRLVARRPPVTARARCVDVAQRGDAAQRSDAEAIARLRVYPGAALSDADLPRVTVVIPTLDGRRLLARCLAALEASDYPRERCEIVVVDNGSRDGTAKLLARDHSRVRLVSNRTNVGFTRAVAQGVEAADRAAVVALLNNDAIVDPGWLRELVSPIARGECAASGSRMLLPDGSAEFLGGGASFQGLALGFAPADALGGAADRGEHPRRALFACGGAMAINARAWRAVGGLDSDFFAYYDDLDLGWRLWLQGFEVHYVPSAICRHARSSTSRRFPRDAIRRLQVRNALLCCIKNYDDAHLDRLLPVLLALAARRAWVMSGRGDASELSIEGERPQPRWKRWWRARRGQRLDPLAFADFAAVNEVLGSWSHWMSRRAEVQARRKRTDSEIFELFLHPLWCIEGEREYVELQSALVERFSVAEMFGRRAHSVRQERLASARGCFESIELRANRIEIAGWAVALDGSIDEVEVLVDGRHVGSARTTARPDVAPSVLGAAGALSSGFRVSGALSASSSVAWRRIETIGRERGRPIAAMACLWRPDFCALFGDPPNEQMLRVAATAAPVVFRLDGLRTLSDFLDALRPHRHPRSITNVLDWGMGCGRVSGFLPALQPTWRVFGCDVDAAAIAWSRSHLPGGEFQAIAADPPTGYASASFDLVLAYSVFTHLDREAQNAWLAELRRVLGEGGILLATVQGPEAARLLGLTAEIEALARHGIADERIDPALDGVLSAGRYRSVFQNEAWTRAHWSRELEVLEYIPRGAQGLQDVVVLRKRRER